MFWRVVLVKDGWSDLIVILCTLMIYLEDPQYLAQSGMISYAIDGRIHQLRLPMLNYTTFTPLCTQLHLLCPIYAHKGILGMFYAFQGGGSTLLRPLPSFTPFPCHFTPTKSSKRGFTPTRTPKKSFTPICILNYTLHMLLRLLTCLLRLWWGINPIYAFL